jgi:hypothetical protein
MTAITSFISFPLNVRACGAQDPAASTKLRRAKSQSPPASNAGAKESNGVPSRRPKCAEMEEFQRATGKFGRTDLTEMPRSGCERPMAFASGGHEFGIFSPAPCAGTFDSTCLGRSFAAFKAGESRERTGVAALILIDMTKF